MEQSMARYNYQSPYRNRTMQIKKMPKILSTLIWQATACTVLFLSLMGISQFNVIKTSGVWQKMIYMLGYDINAIQAKETFLSAVSYLGDRTSEYFEKTQGTVENEESKQGTDESANENINKMKEDVNTILTATTVLRPVEGEAVSRYGKRVDPITNQEELHTGVDLRASIGTSVKSAIQGTVEEVQEGNTSFGNFVRVKNADIITTYAHCSKVIVAKGDKVEQGEVIAYSGDSGKTNGPHLHFEITKGGRYVDPGFLLPASQEIGEE